MSQVEYRLLLVEDEPAFADLLLEYLEDSPESFVVTHCTRLSAAAVAVERGPFDLILLDLSLPDSFGLETLDRAMAFAGDVPIVVMSGSLAPEVVAETVRRGAVGSLPKAEIRAGDFARQLLRFLK